MKKIARSTEEEGGCSERIALISIPEIGEKSEAEFMVFVKVYRRSKKGEHRKKQKYLKVSKVFLYHIANV